MLLAATNLHYTLSTQNDFHGVLQGDPREPDIFKINSTKLFLT